MSEKVLSVSQINQYIKSIVESDYSLMNVTVLGEISTLTKHYTGHFYFTLKDENSSLKCMMFSSYASKLDFDLKNGDQVLIYGYIGVYDKGGVYQLYAQKIIPYGEGEYLLKLAKLKQKLLDEKIIPRIKKDIPLFPKKIALITSKTGAAIHDFLVTINLRYRPEVYIIPALVQGEDAPIDLIRAIDEALKLNVEIIVITRGGGSKEDLKCFNDEMLVRKVATLPLPVIGAIGHQIDTTLLDYAVDKSCITPTDCANNISLSIEELNEKIDHSFNKINLIIRQKIENYYNRLNSLNKILESYNPKNKITLLKQQIYTFKNKINTNFATILNLKLILLMRRKNILELNFSHYLTSVYNNYLFLKNRLDISNPEKLLENGYTYVSNSNKEIVTSVKKIKVNETLSLKLKDGEIITTVKEIKGE